MQGLKSATGYVRRELGHRVRLRRTPEVLFIEDRGIEEGSQVISLIDQLSRERKVIDDDPAESGDSEYDAGADDVAE